MPTIAERLNEALEGRYHIERELGEGGMATVYLAEDLRHGRKVAIKVLRSELAAAVGPERFLSEIRTTAGLQHPHILALHDSGEADGFLFYVMPYIEGESIRARLEREGQLPVDEAVRITTHVAEALHYAHRQGVIHRDIKPANILLAEGEPLVADFGIALAMSEVEDQRLTETGVSLGSPLYMSPEQASGEGRIGPASDVFSLACVLYEMLAGHPPFVGSTAQATLFKILTEDARPITDERRTVPIHVAAALSQALEKLPADRFTSADSFAAALTDPTFSGTGRASVSTGARRPGWTPATTVMAALAVVLAGVAAWALPQDRSETLRLGLSLPRGQELVAGNGARLALSPDGLSFAYVGEGGSGESQIWVRDLRRLGATGLPGTEGGMAPAFSPDGQRVALIRDGSLWVATMDGDPPVLLVDGMDGPEFSGIDWGPDGFIYHGGRGLFRVPDTGGDWEAVVPQDEEGRLHFGPDVLPDGNGAVFALGQNETRSENMIAAADFRTGEIKLLTEGVAVRFSEPDLLLVVRADGRLDVASFDPDRLEISGAARTVATGIGVGEWGSTDLAITATGTLLYATGPQEPRRQVVWVDRSGIEEPVAEGWVGPWESVALSPDRTRLIVGTGFGANPQLWIRTLEGGQMTRLTLEGDLNRRPVWSDEGETVTFISQRGQYRAAYRKRADGVGPAELLLGLEEHVDEVDWSPGGEWLVYRTGMSGGEGRDLYAWHVRGDSARVPIAANPAFDEMSPALSPNGRWLAYASFSDGSRQIYVRSFPNPNQTRLRISVENGGAPVWSGDGSTLFYREGLGPRARMAAVTFAPGPGLSVLERRDLFPVPHYFVTFAASAFDYDDGTERFLMVRQDPSAAQGDLILVRDFRADLTGPESR
jgi:Tol biopolymer transport system component